VIPTLFDLDSRFRIMDQFDGLMQILNIAAPPLENIENLQKTEELAMMANDEMAELVLKYRDRFAAAPLPASPCMTWMWLSGNLTGP
jgi:predicted TIM-barrel fold metal-dependent hydrolase